MSQGKVSLGRSPEEKSVRHGLSVPQAAHQPVMCLPFLDLLAQAWVALRDTLTEA